MAYILSRATIRAANTDEGMARIDFLWKDVVSGKLPILFDSDHNFQKNLSPISEYSNYESDETGSYDLSIMGVTSDFFAEMDEKAAHGLYKKYEEKGSGDEPGLIAKKAWEKVWTEHKTGVIKRAFSKDFESVVPGEYTKDGEGRCYLYIALL